MSKYKLDQYNNKQLQEIIAEAENLIKKNEASEKAELKQQIIAMAADKGYSIDDLLGDRPTATRRKVAPKYRNPDNGQTWTGRGRKPRWVVEALESGRRIEEYAI